MKPLKSVLLFICVVSTMLCLSGCFVQSYYPYFTEQAVQHNVVKFTNFILINKEGKDLLEKPGTNVGSYMIFKHKNGESEQINTTFFKAGKTLFLDAQGFLNRETTMYSSLHSVGTHVLYRVDLGKDRTNLTPLSTKWFIDAAKNNRVTLPNVIRKTDSIEEILFTAKSEEWMKFLEKNGENPDMYDESTVLTLKSVDTIAEKKIDGDLIAAVQKCDTDKVLKLLDNNADANISDQYGNTALTVALSCGTYSIAQQLIIKGADINLGDNEGKTPLIKVIESGPSLEITSLNMNFLLKNGANPNAADKQGSTPLIYATRIVDYHGALDIVKLLISRRAHINHRNAERFSALTTVIKGHSRLGNPDLIMFLIGIGADFNSADIQGITPLMYALWYPRDGVDHRVVEALISKGADINTADKVGRTAFSLAIENNLLNKAKSIDINLFKNPNQTSLNKALLVATWLTAIAKSDEYKSRIDIFAWLLSKGADINAFDTNDFNVLMTAASYVKAENYQFIDYLIEKGVLINAVDSSGRNIVHDILRGTMEEAKKTELVSKFIKAGVNVNHRDNEGNTLLMLSFDVRPLRDVAIALIKNGANVNTKDSKGETALLKAARIGHVDISKVLLEHKADPNIRDSNEISPLMSASKTARYNIVKLLIDNGATFRDGDNINVKCQSEASVVIEPDKRDASEAGSKLQVKIQPPNNEDWLGVICDTGQADQKIMVYDQEKSVFTSEVMIPPVLSKGIHELKCLAVIASGSASNKHNLEDVISYKAKQPREARYVSFKRSFSNN